MQFREVKKEKLKNSRVRHILKTISWRIVGSLDTWLLASFVTKSAGKGGIIALLEVVSKMILYYFHERVWYKIPFGIENGVVKRRRHITKAVSWRILGTLDTMMLAWLVTGNPMDGLKIGMFELVTKMLLYYLHERIWLRINLKWFKDKDGR